VFASTAPAAKSVDTFLGPSATSSVWPLQETVLQETSLPLPAHDGCAALLAVQLTLTASAAFAGSNGKQYDNECLAKCENVAVVGEASGSGCSSAASGQSAAGPVTIDPATSGPVARPTAQSSGPIATQSSGSSVAEPRPATAGSGPAGTVGQNLPQPSNPRQPVGRFGGACGCQLSYEPVCGKDAKWYPNMCSLSCAGVGLSAVKPDSYGNCLVG
jgi:hypothetical protein